MFADAAAYWRLALRSHGCIIAAVPTGHADSPDTELG
jgi:hypothetical protein